MKPSDISEVLFKAAKLLEKHGWTRGEYLDKNGSMCAVGAISAALGKQGADSEWDYMLGVPCIKAVEAHLYCGDGTGPVQNLNDWNDEKAKDMREVTDAFRRTAEALLT